MDLKHRSPIQRRSFLAPLLVVAVLPLAGYKGAADERAVLNRVELLVAESLADGVLSHGKDGMTLPPEMNLEDFVSQILEECGESCSSIETEAVIRAIALRFGWTIVLVETVPTRTATLSSGRKRVGIWSKSLQLPGSEWNMNQIADLPEWTGSSSTWFRTAAQPLGP